MSYEDEVHKALHEMTDDELNRTIAYREGKCIQHINSWKYDEWREALQRAKNEKSRRYHAGMEIR
jgi:hypothetical protein